MQHHRTIRKKIQFGLIGKSLAHSFSSDYHNSRFQREGISAYYSNFELDEIEHIIDLIATTPSIVGLNVTVPFKQSVIPFLDEISAEATLVDAVNTIVVNDGKMIGHNTDVFGFERSLQRWIDVDINRALVLGTGGASRAVIKGLNNLGIKSTSVSRTPGEEKISYEDITKNMMRTHDLIINTTPLGMHPGLMKMPLLPFEEITEKHWVYDLVYNPEKTILLSRCEEFGAQIKNGLEMLHLQADKSWIIWKHNLEHEHGRAFD